MFNIPKVQKYKETNDELNDDSDVIITDEHGKPSKTWRQNNDRTIKIAICQLPSGQKLETKPYYNYSWKILTPHKALIKAYPKRKSEILQCSYIKWTYRFWCRIYDHA